MAVTVGGKTLGPKPQERLQWLANLYTEAEAIGVELKRIEEKIVKQNTWLDDHAGHPDYSKRCQQNWSLQQKRGRLEFDVRGLAATANKIIEGMDQATRETAKRDISIWAAMGAVGIEAVAFGITPDPLWLIEENTEPCPY